MSAAKEQAASLVKSTAENVVDSAVSKMEDKVSAAILFLLRAFIRLSCG